MFNRAQAIKFLLLSFLTLCVLGKAAAIDIQMQKQMDIERSLLPEQYKTMQLDTKQVFYLEQANKTAINKGLAILIPDISISMASQQGLALLAKELNQLGWATVTFNAPSIMQTSNPSAAKDPQQSTNSDTASQEQQAAPRDISIHSKKRSPQLTAQQFAELESSYIDLLAAGVKKAGEYPGYYLVIAQGSSAAWLTKIYAEVKSNIPDALVAISPYWQERKYNQQLPEFMAKTAMPILDIYTQWDNDWVLQSAPKRKAAAVKGLKLHYRQRQLLGRNQTTQLAYSQSREIHGWLTNMGW